MEWIGLGILIFLGLLFFAPDIVLLPVGYAFAAMMEPSKSRRLVSHGIVLALFGPTLIAALVLLSWLLAWLEFRWLAGGCLIAAATIFLAWVIAGIVLGIVKSRQKAAEEQHSSSDQQAEE